MNLKGITKATWTRLIVLVILLINQISISVFGFALIPFNDEQIYEAVSTVLTVIIAIIASYKNNSITSNAQQADKYLNDKKKENK